MIFHRLGLINNNQAGFTLIELILVIAITGIITGSITMTISQVFTNNAHSIAHMTAIKEVENTIHWISRDVQMAQIVVTDDPAAVLTLTWVEWDNTVNQVTYRLENDQLHRNHSINGQTIVARHIDSIEVTPKPYSGGKLTLTITAAIGSASETRVCEVIPRPAL